MNRRILLSFATLALAVIVAVPASAECPNPQCFQSAFTDTGNNLPVVFLPGSATDHATVVGRFWNADNAAALNTGTCIEDIWLQQWANDPPGTDENWYIIGQMGADLCLNTGVCMPDSASFFLTVETTSLDGASASFTVARAKNTFVVQDPSSSCDFDFSRGSAGAITMVPVPKPRVTSSNRAGNIVTLDLSLDDVTGGFRSPAADGFTAAGSIVGFKLLEATSPVDPGRNPAAWTVKSTIPNSGGPNTALGVTVDCATNVAHWIATVPVFEGGATDVDGTYAGEAVQIRCDTNLANPGRMKPIDKKKIVPGERN